MKTVRVLLVEDNPLVLDLVKKGLDAHCDLSTVSDGADALLKVIEDAPDLIISVHPLAQEFTVEALEAMGTQTPFVIVVTDLATGHPVWFHPAAQLAFVASQAAWDTALARGLRPDQLRLYGLPVRPEFAQPPRPRSSPPASGRGPTG